MTTYTIKDLEHLSGVKAHTIRIWEQRYELLDPERTDTNIRYYSEHDLKKLLNVATLKENGFKISKIANMQSDQINSEVALLTDTFGEDEEIAELTIAMIDMDPDRFQKTMSRNIAKWGFEETMMRLVYPFLKRIGVLWLTGSIVPAQEHFISNLIRQKLIAAIDSMSNNHSADAETFVLFLPEGELHEMSLLFAEYIIRARGNKTVYLGQSVPLEDLGHVCEAHQPQYALTILTASPWASSPEDFITALSPYLVNTKLMISGISPEIERLDPPENVQIFPSVLSFIDFLDK